MNDPKRLAWCRQRACALEGRFSDCSGPVEAHHPTGAGLALKAPDGDAFPLCHGHHMDRHNATGPFKCMTKVERKAWEADMVANYQALYEADSKGDEF